jgi:hypothetical protein
VEASRLLELKPIAEFAFTSNCFGTVGTHSDCSRDHIIPHTFIGWRETSPVFCGVPDEKYWLYTLDGTHVNPNWDSEPSAFLYAVADNFEALKYFCHDPQGANVPTATVLLTVKQYLSAGIPSMFGFWGFPSFNDTKVLEMKKPGGYNERIPYHQSLFRERPTSI